MSQNITQKSRLTLLVKRWIVPCTAIICFSSIFWVKVYTGKEQYDWKAHARIEEKAPKPTANKRKHSYQTQKIDLALKKLSPEQMSQAQEVLQLQQSIQDYKEKMKLHAQKSNAHTQALEKRLKSLEASLEKLKKQHPQP